ncbi:hypothetical protein CRG98_009145 [Punica granatum]|uniref:Uncharacterized protein n=1 Tax=Punica granatum TaxID=22663 RepID=A0A2I0KPQ5_PUNGR|nr:hypothetical protein CRG98_009145 [Punica granatum]
MSTNSLDRPGLCKNPKKAKEPVDLFGSDLERSSVSLPELLGIRVLGCKGMHVWGAKRTGACCWSARGRAGGIRRTRGVRRAGVWAGAWGARACEGSRRA